MMSPLGSTMTPEPRLRSFRSRGTSNRLKNSSPKNRRKNGSSKGIACGPSPALVVREVKIFTTAGLTALATDTKFRSPPIETVVGGEVCGNCTGFTGESGTACPNGSQPTSEANTTPIRIPAPNRRPLSTNDRVRGCLGPCVSRSVTILSSRKFTAQVKVEQAFVLSLQPQP